jgi:hypothetical protein
LTSKEDRVSPQDPSPTDQVDVETWLDALGQRVPPGTLEQAGPEERVVLLDLARIAAHRSQRWAAPISTYLVGLAFASLPRAERLDRMRALVAEMDATAE